MRPGDDRHWPVLPLLLAAALVAGAGVAAALVAGGASGGSSTGQDAAVKGAAHVEITACGPDAGAFELLCDVYARLDGSYVDPIDDTALARAAADGIRSRAGDLVAGSETDDAGAPPACAAPSEPFAVMCDAYGQVVTGVGADVPVDPLVEAAIVGMLADGLQDPHTAYVPPEDNALLEQSLSGRVEGIGAIVELRGPDGEPCPRVSSTCDLVVVSPVPGGPSADAGIRAGDVIIELGDVPLRGMTILEAVAHGRGPSGTAVDVTIQRDGTRIERAVTRREFTVPQVDARLLGDDVGYVRLATFAGNSATQFRDALAGLLDQGARDLVIDLRDNPGGYLDVTRDIAGDLMTGPVVRVEEAGGERETLEADGPGLATEPDVDVAVLVNHGSASASEVLAAALRDAGRAIVVGERTFGKGTVQGAWDLDNGGSLRVTVARWLTPAGENIEGAGIAPDVRVRDDDPDDGADAVLERAVRELRPGS